MRIPAAVALAVLITQTGPPTSFGALEPAGPRAAGTLVNALADFDGDKDPDLFVGFAGTEPNRLYRNDEGKLTDVAKTAGIADQRATRAAAWGDYDADGDPDLIVGFAPLAGAGILTLYRNDAGQFTDVSKATGLAVEKASVRQLAWIDVDADGDLDLFVAFRDRPNALYRNEKGRFSDVARDLGLADARRSVGAVWLDYEQDGDLDLLTGNMDGDANGLYRHDAGRFTDVAEAAGIQWGGRKPGDAANGTVRPSAADVDGDGRFDIVMANYGPLGLFLNRGSRFEDVSVSWGVALDARYDTAVFSDVDHDGRLDMYVNGTVTGGVSYRDYLFRNTGARFDEATPDRLAAIDADHGAAWADIDGDGDEDLLLTGAGKTPIPLLLLNALPPDVARRSLHVRVVDARGLALLAGAEVRLYAAGTGRLLGARLVDSGSGYNSQNDIPVHFGLAAAGRVDVEVVWPGAGRRLTVRSKDIDPAKQREPLVVRVGGS